MTHLQRDLFQAAENVEEKSEAAAETPENEVFFNSAGASRICVICGASFDPGPRSKITTCSPPCGRERRLRYGAAYRQQGREARQKLLDMFGGRRPTGEELLQLHRDRKGQP